MSVAILGVIVVAFSRVFLSYEMFTGGGFLVVSVASAVVVLHLVGAPDGLLGRVLSLAPFVAIGRISYGLYLWHLPIFKVLSWATSPSPVVAVAMKFVVTFVVAGLSWRYVERAALRLKHRFEAVRG